MIAALLHRHTDSLNIDDVQAELDRLMRCMSYGLALRNLTPKVQLEVFRYFG